MALASGTRLGPYEVVEPLGSGGMGEVYRARDPRLGREVAVKLVATEGEPSPDRLRRFETEARAAAALSHPNVVTVFDVGTHDGHPYLVLELLEGETLRETLRSGVPALREAVTWALEVSRGLGAAHERGIVHRDLKPENVFLTRDGRVKVLDFGLAKLHEPLVSDEADRESPTATRGTSPGVLLQVRVWTEDGRGPVRLPGGAAKAEWTSTGLLVTGAGHGAASSDPWRAHVWSFPAVKRVHTFDFGLPTWWQVGTEHLLTESLLSGTPGPGPWEQPREYLLRSWRLPDGEPEELGRVRVTTEATFFEPGGRAWLYREGNNAYGRRLPVTRDDTAELLLPNVSSFRHIANRRPWLRSTDEESGDVRVWSYTTGSLELVRRIPRPETAFGANLRPEASGRWVVDRELKGNRGVRLWSTSSLPGARPLVLRRSGSWSDADHAFHPAGDWLVASTHALSHLTFWPLHRTTPIVVDGYSPPGGLNRPVRFSHDSQWLATFWTWTLSEGIRLWPLPGAGSSGIRTLDVPYPSIGFRLEFDPEGRFLFVVRGGGSSLSPWIVPLDGSPVRLLESPSPTRYLFAASVSPSGRSVATATQQAVQQGTGETVLVVWDVATGERRLFDLPEVPSTPQGFEAAVNSVHFVDETTLYTAGVAGVLRWDLGAGTHEIVFAGEPRTDVKTEMSADGRVALARWYRIGESRQSCAGFEILHPESGAREALTSFGDCPLAFAVDPSGTVAVTGDFDGVVRVGRLSGGEPHLLFGHEGSIDSIAVSPDQRWVASTKEDNTLRLWPMPDLEKPPLHTLPHDELMAKLESLTNLRAVRDPESSTGWTIELGPFPGWADVPTW